ncbi:MAG TPA: amidohydrolase family protein [Solirubrobacterales bacterium]|nr:amidohydrolase family protein [Solirubrobacterales bacterium]
MADSPDKPTIDFHSHMLERAATEAGLPHCVATGFGARMEKPKPGTAFFRAQEASYDPAVHVEALDRLGIDAEVVSSTSVIQGTAWASPEREYELNRAVNDEIERWVDSYPERLIGCFNLPLQDPKRSLEEIERLSSNPRFPAVQLPACLNGVYLGEPEFRYLWEEIDGRGLVVFLHPDGTRDEWFQSFSMWNSVGQPVEEAKLLASLIYWGVLEDLPDLKIVVAHGGGYLPHYFGRLDRNVTAWPESTRNISRRPSEYLREMYYDTCLYEPAMLEALIARAGASQIVMGSDFPVGESDPLGFVARSPSLSAPEIEAVQGGTAAALLGYVKLESGGVAPATA